MLSPFPITKFNGAHTKLQTLIIMTVNALEGEKIANRIQEAP